MNIDKISIGANAPWDINVIIEIPQGGLPVKYEMDKDSGALFVDRFLHTAMYYPGNYGFVPHTLGGDGDPCDVLVIAPTPVMAGSVIRVRPVGVLIMTDEKGEDEKILAVPVNKLHPFYNDVTNYDQLPQILLDQISHFFERYKDLENKKTNITGWANAEKAAALIQEGIERHNAQK